MTEFEIGEVFSLGRVTNFDRISIMIMYRQMVIIDEWSGKQ